jgi:hypothetical protein
LSYDHAKQRLEREIENLAAEDAALRVSAEVCHRVQQRLREVLDRLRRDEATQAALDALKTKEEPK